MPVRGIRGATTVKNNSKVEIVSSTEELLKELVAANKIKIEDIASAVFSVTGDLNAEFPAVAARNLGWLYTPLLCTYEIDVPGSVKKCVRVLLHVNTGRKQSQITNVYLWGAKVLRPDLRAKRSGLYYSS
jgi:chorismate mutase